MTAKAVDYLVETMLLVDANLVVGLCIGLLVGYLGHLTTRAQSVCALEAPRDQKKEKDWNGKLNEASMKPWASPSSQLSLAEDVSSVSSIGDGDKSKNGNDSEGEFESNNDVTFREEDASDKGNSMQVLDAAIGLFAKQFRQVERDASAPGMGSVVAFKSPQDLLKKFQEENDSNCSLSLAGKDDLGPVTVETMGQMLQTIQKYSVQTSHPYFFNQLFGALDPVAVAGELIALSVNTSAATFEMAPVFTMLESEVVKALAHRVFTFDNDHTKDTVEAYDGLMLPGGSISNLTAMHVARHHYVQEWIKHQHDDVDGDVDAGVVKSYSMSDAIQLLQPKLMAYVTDEAHYSFKKAATLIGLTPGHLEILPTSKHSNYGMDCELLQQRIQDARENGLHPFFVGATSGSTVRGSFDPLVDLVATLHKDVGAAAIRPWLHVDGAWGGCALFLPADHPNRTLLAGVSECDSFTWNPHKMLGAPQQTTCLVTRHAAILKQAHSTKAKYLFDPRKHGADFDLGDGTFTCGRRTDAIKLWTMWKFHGAHGLGQQVVDKIDILQHLTLQIRKHPAFMMACGSWPFNVNFYYLPKGVRDQISTEMKDGDGSTVEMSDEVAESISKATVALKLKLHAAGEMLIPYQPLNDRKADCFRLVLAGHKSFTPNDVAHIMTVMDEFGRDL